MLRSTPTLFIVVGLMSAAYSQEPHYWGEELSPIFEVISQDHRSGFLEVSQGYYPMRLPGLPQFRTGTTNENSPLQNLRKIVANVPGMAVSQSTNGTFLMRQKSVPADILDIRIGHLRFADDCFHDIYSANRALMLILQAPEVSGYLNSHNIAVIGMGSGVGIGAGCGLPPLGTPHFSASVDNVTVAEALERVLKEFPGEILVYWNFPKEQDTTAATASRHKRPQLLPNFFSQCQSSLGDAVSRTPSPDLTDPLCLPPAAFSSAFPGWLFPIRQFSIGPARRRVYFHFFSENGSARRQLSRAVDWRDFCSTSSDHLPQSPSRL